MVPFKWVPMLWGLNSRKITNTFCILILVTKVDLRPQTVKHNLEFNGHEFLIALFCPNILGVRVYGVPMLTPLGHPCRITLLLCVPRATLFPFKVVINKLVSYYRYNITEINMNYIVWTIYSKALSNCWINPILKVGRIVQTNNMLNQTIIEDDSLTLY
jgi:hypothetical protein